MATEIYLVHCERSYSGMVDLCPPTMRRIGTVQEDLGEMLATLMPNHYVDSIENGGNTVRFCEHSKAGTDGAYAITIKKAFLSSRKEFDSLVPYKGSGLDKILAPARIDPHASQSYSGHNLSEKRELISFFEDIGYLK